MDKQIFEKIKDFTVKQSGVSANKVVENAEIENDLGISGDDATDFLLAFSKEFKVDISDFMAAEYFSPEGDPILPAIRLFTGKKSPKRKELRIKHLGKAVSVGRLDEEAINS